MADLVLALDQGTSSSRAILFDHAGNAVGSAQKPFEQIYPRPGWVEHDPEEIWQTPLATAKHGLRQAKATADDVAAIGITQRRETTVSWDRGRRPIANAIVWQDRRTAPLCEELRKKGLEPLFRERTGLLLDPYFSGTKVKWLLDNVDGARARADSGDLMFGTIDSWLVYRLTGLHVTDYTNASRTLLYNIFDLRWDEELLRDELGIISTAAESQELAMSVPDSNGVYIVPAFVGLGAPHWDPTARGAIFGLTRGANRAHLARATLEAIAFQTCDVIEAIEADSGVTLSELRVDGGAAANDLLLQIQADLLGREVVRPAVLETTALGAAYLAGLATGFWKNAAEVTRNWREDRRFSPQMPAGRRDEMYAGWKTAVERVKGWSSASA